VKQKYDRNRCNWRNTNSGYACMPVIVQDDLDWVLGVYWYWTSTIIESAEINVR
jgi:hypothetical protein